VRFFFTEIGRFAFLRPLWRT